MKDLSDKEFDEIIVELNEFADNEGTEWGETAQRLINMWWTQCLLSKTLVKALKKEILSYHKYAKKNTQWVEYDEEHSIKRNGKTEVHVRKVRELEWLDQ